jgi:hypothetical protein
MPGTVYVLNATAEAISLRVNNIDAGTVPAGTEDASVGFKPGVLKVARSTDPQPGTAVFGTSNTMEVQSPGQDTVYKDIQIKPSAYPLNQDLEMYLFYSAAVLCREGQVVWGEADPAGDPPAQIRIAASERA